MKDPGTAPGLEGSLYYSANNPFGSVLTPVGPNPVAWPAWAQGGNGIPTLDFSTANRKVTWFSMTFGGALGNYGVSVRRRHLDGLFISGFS
jgi:hypothetical protein